MDKKKGESFTFESTWFGCVAYVHTQTWNIDFEARSKLDMKYRKVTFIVMSLDIDLGIRKIKKSSEVKMPYSIRK